MPEPIPVNPAVLVWARHSALATLDEAAAHTGKDAKVVADWEAGRERPTWGQLENLAEEYGISANVLLLPEAPDVPQPPPDFRSPSGQEALSRATRRELRRARHLQALLAEVRVLPPPRIPVIGQGQNAAAVVRDALGVTIDEQLAWPNSNRAFNEWRMVFNRLGILVLQYALPYGELQGLSLASAAGGPPVVLINQSDWINARVFTLLHELGHLVLAHEGGICDPWRQGPRVGAESLEARCNRLAGAVLVPGDHLEAQPEAQQTGSSADDELVLKLLRTLANRYSVSNQVIWYRMRETGLVSARRFHDLWPQIRPPAKKKRPRKPDEADQKGVPRWWMAGSRYGPQLVNGLLSAVDRGSLDTIQVMRALNLGAGDLVRLQGGS
jgi:Zn-dependent peptidase ImmA (M78 family)/transcriptional regulator with XRE-family HTH domain